MHMTSSRDKGKRKLPINQGSTKNYKLRYLKAVIRPSMFKLQSLPITPDELPNRTSFLDLVVPDERNNPFWCFWSPIQNGKIALTRGWQEFYQTYKINLDSMLYFKHKGNSNFQVQIFDFSGIENSYQLRDPEEPPYVRTSNFQTAKCINIPPSARVKAVAAKPNVPHLSHFTAQRHPLILTHGHIKVEATYTRYSGKRDGGVGIFEVISTEPITIIQLGFDLLRDECPMLCGPRNVKQKRVTREGCTHQQYLKEAICHQRQTPAIFEGNPKHMSSEADPYSSTKSVASYFYIIFITRLPYHVSSGEYLSGGQMHLFIISWYLGQRSGHRLSRNTITDEVHANNSDDDVPGAVFLPPTPDESRRLWVLGDYMGELHVIILYNVTDDR
ncbi:hypothetical protein Ahy_A01g002358 [Arachis hypogaea]|uniref:TF-B3 domain-containing protein n=1 Tax=Arachis hypogaea TaxID=3818 RepID=A0A445EQS4_ARAHY|nr:hypothetical protein Ahy_A01g002358 [Arachis hypogaea]